MCFPRREAQNKCLFGASADGFFASNRDEKWNFPGDDKMTSFLGLLDGKIPRLRVHVDVLHHMLAGVFFFSGTFLCLTASYFFSGGCLPQPSTTGRPEAGRPQGTQSGG